MTAKRKAASGNPAQAAAAAFPIVGLGASAGGLAAFEAFFSGMPGDAHPGMAFVLVQHLAPDHKSMLTELIQRTTRMKVLEAVDGVVVQPDCAYIIPPNRNLAFHQGALQVTTPLEGRGPWLPIDSLFRSLAEDLHERAIGIVLSGTGSDGTLGLRAIKGEGGMAMAQNPGSSQYDGMPLSALATGLVDYELPPAEMPAQLMSYVAHAFGHPPQVAPGASPKVARVLAEIFGLLRAQTGHEFSQYKANTILRRIERRLALNRIESLEAYAGFLKQTPSEVEALFRDLLIGVTQFFRDPWAFEVLEEKAVAGIFAGEPTEGGIRVWCPGCSTGEEAYSIAILLQERMEALGKRFKAQVFATDLDMQAITIARSGLYPASIASDLTPERLARFFVREHDGRGYRIRKTIRDLVVFSQQNVIKDPPFSRLDLISCRNLLIYLGSELQKKVISLFHYALRPGGFLFQGTAEAVGDFGELFEGVDRKAKLYRRLVDLTGSHGAAQGRILAPMARGRTAPGAGPATAAPAAKLLRELTERALLEQAGAAGVLVNGQGEVLFLHGRAGAFLELPPGEAGINNILKLARDGLRRELTTCLHRAVGSQATVHCPGLRVRTNEGFCTVDLTISPVAMADRGGPSSALYLVILRDAPAAEGQASLEGQPGLAALRRELQAKDDYLKATNEALELSNQDLKTSNEELQSMNEEFQSTNEELETSKEELQSLNEELSTVNNELQTKVGDLSRANNDMNNLLAGTGVGTVFVDRELRILRFTPAATRIINFIQSDVGRPLGHLVSNLVDYDRLEADLHAVLDSLKPIDAEVRTRDGRWYAMSIQPYRTLENVIEGAVLTFGDITALKGAARALAESEARFQQRAEPEAVAVGVRHD
jgi:two-component system CheB/CheR fusion protein